MNSLDLRKLIRKSIESKIPSLVETVCSLPYFYGKYSSDITNANKTILTIEDLVLKAIDDRDIDDTDVVFLDIDKEFIETEVNFLMDSLESRIIKASYDGYDIADVVDGFVKNDVSAFLHEKFLFMKNRAILKSIIDEETVYKSFGGPTCFVSILPRTSCPEAFTDDGSVRIFTASQLLSRPELLQKGSVVPVPPGYVWEGRKLIKVSDSLVKASQRLADPPRLSNEGRKLAASRDRAGLGDNPPSMPGQASIAQTGNVKGQPGISNPKQPGGGTGKPGDGVPVWYLPKDKVGNRPPVNVHHTTDKSYAIPVGQSARMPDGTEYSESQYGDKSADQKKPASPPPPPPTNPQQAKAWTKAKKPNDVVLSHMATGKINSAERLAGPGVGINASYRCVIQGNGRGVMKPSITFDYDSPMYTAGKTAIPSGEGHIREAAAYEAATFFGLTDHIPPTAARRESAAFAGEDGEVDVSMQHWQEDYGSAYTTMVQSTPDGKIGNAYAELMNRVPETHKEYVKNKIAEITTLQVVLGNNDFHYDNLIVSKDFTDVKAIDNSLTMGYGVEGIRNTWFEDMYHAGEELKVPDHLLERFKNTTLSDIKRSFGSKLSDEAAAHVFLRMKYVVHLQEKEGSLDYEKFRTTLDGYPELHIAPDISKIFYGDDGAEYFLERAQSNTLPTQLYASFVKKWIKDNKWKTRDAWTLSKVGVLRDVWQSYKDVNSYRNSGKHKEFYNSIEAADPVDKMPISKRKYFGKYKPTTVSHDSATVQQEGQTSSASQSTAQPSSEDQNYRVQQREALLAQMREAMRHVDEAAKQAVPVPAFVQPQAPTELGKQATVRDVSAERLGAQARAKIEALKQKKESDKTGGGPTGQLHPDVRDAIKQKLGKWKRPA